MKQKYDFLQIKDIKRTISSIEKFVKEEILNEFQRKGAVIGISGGIDSAVMASICTRSVNPHQVLGLIMPEKESDPSSEILAKKIANQLDIKTKVIDITSILESFGVYDNKENVIKEKFSNFNNNCMYSVRVPSKFGDSVGIPFLEILDDENKKHQIKISASEFLNLTASSSIKHRVRMVVVKAA